MFLRKNKGVPLQMGWEVAKRLILLMLRLSLILLVGATSLFLIAKFTADREITFGYKFGVLLGASALTTVMLDDDPDISLEIALKRSLAADSEMRRIEKALVLDKDYKVLAAKLVYGGSLGQKDSETKDKEIAKEIESLVGNQYADWEKLKGLVAGSISFDESWGTTTVAAPIFIGKGADERVTGYLLLTLNQNAAAKAMNWLTLGLVLVLAAIGFTEWKIIKFFRVLLKFSSLVVVNKFLSEEWTSKPEKVRVVVGHVDMVGFTSVAGDKTPDEVIQLLNQLFALVSPVVDQFGGVIDKYIGDAILWYIEDKSAKGGMPIKICAQNAALICHLMQYIVKILNFITLRYRGGQARQIRIGVVSGTCVRGELGSKIRTDYTLIGLVVALAQRIESACKPDGAMFSGYVFGDMGEGFLIGTKSDIQAKNVDKPVTVHQSEKLVLPKSCAEMKKYLLNLYCGEKPAKECNIDLAQHEDLQKILKSWLDEVEKKGFPLPAPDIK